MPKRDTTMLQRSSLGRTRVLVALLVGWGFGVETIVVQQPAVAQVQGQEQAVLTDAPFVPPPMTRKHPTKVLVHLEVREVIQHLADGVEYTSELLGAKSQANLSGCYRVTWWSSTSITTQQQTAAQY